ncbi:MAG: gluconate 2-dehydrogenase subunit 3 family protein [Bacteroidota bacterium]
MERRIALKNMGMVFGYAVATPTLLGIVQSCQSKPAYADWVPQFFSKDEGMAIAQMLDIILPKTETPSATEQNVHVFFDEFANSVLPEEQQEFVKMAMGKFFDKVLQDSGEESLVEIKPAAMEPILATYLKKRSDEQEKAHEEAIGQYMEAKMKSEETVLDDEIARFAFANNVRDMAIWAYKSSEFIGEEVLAYLPVPGEYIACGDAKELTADKAWSL